MDISTLTVPASGLKLDVHLPAQREQVTKLPLLFACHPGGLVSYGRTHLPPWLFGLAAREGWAVVTPEYRLLVSQEGGTAEDCLNDVLAAYSWVWQELGNQLDSRKVAAVGFSAGGYLSLLLPSQLPKELPLPTSLVLLYPVVSPLTSPFYSTPRPAPDYPSLGLSDIFCEVSLALYDRCKSAPVVKEGDGIDLTADEKRRREQKGGEGYRGQLYDWMIEMGTMRNVWLSGSTSPVDPPSSAQTLARLSPSSNLNPSSAIPRSFVIHGTHDTLVPQSETDLLAKHLSGRVEVRKVEGVDHGFDGEDSLDGRWKDLWEQVGAWIGEGFEGKLVDESRKGCLVV